MDHRKFKLFESERSRLTNSMRAVGFTRKDIQDFCRALSEDLPDEVELSRAQDTDGTRTGDIGCVHRPAPSGEGPSHYEVEFDQACRRIRMLQDTIADLQKRIKGLEEREFEVG